MPGVTHWDEGPDYEALMKAARGGRFSQWMYARSRARDRALIAENGRWHWWVFLQVPLRFVCYLAALFLVIETDRDSWWFTFGTLVLALVAVSGILGSLARAQSYRNGWTDRGEHDKTVHRMVCGDPVAQEQFERAMTATNMEAFKRG